MRLLVMAIVSDVIRNEGINTGSAKNQSRSVIVEVPVEKAMMMISAVKIVENE